MGVHFLAKKLLEGIMAQITKTENIERLSVTGQARPEIEDLKNDLIKNKEIAQQIIQEINESSELNPEKIRKLEEKVKALEEKNAEKDEQIKDLQTQLAATQNELKEMKSALHTGQIAFDFEKDLAKYVYPEGKKIGSRQIFTRMKKWLKDKKDTPQGREANERWKALQVEFSWSGKHERVFDKLLKSRRGIAHPTVELHEVTSQIPDDFNDEEKECIEDIVNMIERVNELME